MLLVVGANGFVGSQVAAYFRAQGLPVCTASHRPGADVVLDLMDLGGTAEWIRALGVTHALICSGISDIDRCKREQQQTWTFNVMGVIGLVSTLREAGVMPIFCSTDMVFGDGSEGWSETAKPCPETQYGWQKLAAEEALKLLGGDYAVLRMSKLYARDGGEGSVIHHMLATLKSGGTLRAASDQIVVPTLVTDVARVVAEIVQRKLTGMFHVTPRNHYSRHGLARLLAERIGAEAQVVPCSIDDFQMLETRPKALWLDGATTVKTTGVKPVELEDILDDILTLTGMPTPLQGAA